MITYLDKCVQQIYPTRCDKRDRFLQQEGRGCQTDNCEGGCRTNFQMTSWVAKGTNVYRQIL